MGTLLTPRRAGLAAALALTATLTACGGTSSDDNAASAPAADNAATTDTGAVGVDTAAAPAAASAPKAAKAGTTTAAAGSAAVPGATDSGTVAAGVPADIAAGADRKNARGVSVPDAALTGRDVIYTADLTVQVEDVTQAVAQIEGAVRAAGGFVAGSERSTDAAAPVPSPSAGEPGAKPAPAPRSSATMTLRVPPGGFNSVLDRLAELGLVVDRKLTGQDVTETVVDVKSRIASARASVDRIRGLMERAVTLRDVVALEGELSQREADLDALLARQTSLKDQTALASVTVHLKTAEALAASAAEDDDEGFTAGLANGWDAFSDSATAGATVVGALVPFAAAVLLLGPPLWWLGVRIQRTGPTLRRKVSPIEPS